MSNLLCTNACIRYLNGRSPELVQKIRQTPASEIFVCSVVKAELFYGAMKSQQPAQTLANQLRFLNQFVSLPFDDAAARIFGDIRADLTRKGTLIGAYDLQIAAIALANNMTLITHNTAEFSRVVGLNLDDWEI